MCYMWNRDKCYSKYSRRQLTRQFSSNSELFVVETLLSLSQLDRELTTLISKPKSLLWFLLIFVVFPNMLEHVFLYVLFIVPLGFISIYFIGLCSLTYTKDSLPQHVLQLEQHLFTLEYLAYGSVNRFTSLAAVSCIYDKIVEK